MQAGEEGEREEGRGEEGEEGTGSEKPRAHMWVIVTVSQKRSDVARFASVVTYGVHVFHAIFSIH